MLKIVPLCSHPFAWYISFFTEVSFRPENMDYSQGFEQVALHAHTFILEGTSL